MRALEKALLAYSRSDNIIHVPRSLTPGKGHLLLNPDIMYSIKSLFRNKLKTKHSELKATMEENNLRNGITRTIFSHEMFLSSDNLQTVKP